MNGRPRDSIATDLSHGRPTLAPDIDELARSVFLLVSGTDQERLVDDLHRAVASSAAYGEWLHDPDAYLADLDAPCVAGIAAELRRKHAELLTEARERGWEVSE